MGVTAAIATVIGTVGSIVTGIMNKPPSAPADTSTQDANAAAQAQAQALARRRGFASTMLTSPTGISGAPTTQRATLGT